MFWGHVLKEGEQFQLSKDDLSKVLHISSATLGMNPKKGKHFIVAD